MGNVIKIIGTGGVGAPGTIENSVTVSVNSALSTQVTSAAPQQVQLLDMASCGAADTVNNTTKNFMIIALVQYEA